MNKHHPSGYTLVELMVVVTILCVLLSLLMPALNTVTQQARNTACLANLNQIGSANQTYDGDFPGWACPAQWRNTANWSGTWVQWAGILVGVGYLSAPMALDAVSDPSSGKPLPAASPFHCPEGLTDEFTSTPNSLYDPENLRAYPSRVIGIASATALRNISVWYGLNAQSAAGDYPTWRVAPDNDTGNYRNISRIRRINSPTSTIFTYDGNSGVNPSSYRISRRHNGGNAVNISFWDGHAGTVGAFDLPYLNGTTYWSVTALNNLNRKIKWMVTQ